MRQRKLLFLLAAIACVSGCQKAPEQVWMSTPELDISFDLTDENGNRATSDSFSGRLRLVFFGFASCPDICPVTLQNIGIALKSLGPLAEQVTVLFVSVDPKRDTPDVLKDYTDAFHPSIIGLTGTHDQLSEVTSGFRTTFGYTMTTEDGQELPLSREQYEELPDSANYFPYHSSKVYLIGRKDELLDLIGYGSKPAQIEEKLRIYVD